MSPTSKNRTKESETPSASKSDTTSLKAEKPRPSGSQRVAPYVRLRTLLLRYLSAILVDTVLNQAMFKRGLSTHRLTMHELTDLAPDIMLGLRLFVAERKLPELMVELAELLQESDS
jgi:hypothetical protein